MKSPVHDLDSEEARRVRGRPPVPRELIIATALDVIDEGGADALSMRALAQRLDSGTATIYRHFADRKDLVAHMVDRVFGEVDLTSDELGAMGWQEACARIAHTMFYAFGNHPNLAPFLVEQVPMGPHAMQLREYCIAALLNGGFSPKLAARSWATLGRYVVGFAIQAHGQGAMGIDHARQSSPFQHIDASRFPATVRVARALPVSIEDEFTFGLDLILDGISRLAKAKASARRTRRRTAR
jgi:AcrR family transcriptional regulator